MLVAVVVEEDGLQGGSVRALEDLRHRVCAGRKSPPNQNLPSTSSPIRTRSTHAQPARVDTTRMRNYTGGTEKHGGERGEEVVLEHLSDAGVKPPCCEKAHLSIARETDSNLC